MSADACSRAQRRRDTEHRGHHHIDAWVVRRAHRLRPACSGHASRWFRNSPRRIQASREAHELPDRGLMRDGRWLVYASAGRAACEGGLAQQMETR
jgi:hypothetical protein